jgi:peptidoglycan/LPS O-acetylase OafA/YrhL
LYLVIKASSFNYRLTVIDKILTQKWAIFIGKISYGIYLYHIMVQYFFSTYIFSKIWNTIPFDNFGYFSKLKYNETLIKFPFTISLTILIAYLSFRFIESPILGLKDKYFKKETIVGKPVIIERSSAL